MVISLASRLHLVFHAWVNLRLVASLSFSVWLLV